MELLAGDGKELYLTDDKGMREVRDRDGNQIKHNAQETIQSDASVSETGSKPEATGDWKADEIAKVDWMIERLKEDKELGTPWTTDDFDKFPYNHLTNDKDKTTSYNKAGVVGLSFMGNLLAGVPLALMGSTVAPLFLSNALSKFLGSKSGPARVIKHKKNIIKELGELKGDLMNAQNEEEVPLLYGELRRKTAVDNSELDNVDIHGTEEHQKLDTNFRTGQKGVLLLGLAFSGVIALASDGDIAMWVNSGVWSLLSLSSGYKFGKHARIAGKNKINQTVYEGLELDKKTFAYFNDNQKDIDTVDFDFDAEPVENNDNQQTSKNKNQFGL